METKVHFFFEDCSFTLDDHKKHTNWILQCSEIEGVDVDSVNYIFCSDSYLVDINIKYLDHNCYTDIITFDNSNTDKIFSDIFISVDRAAENAAKFKVQLHDEIRRLMIHGLLHLIGFGDGTAEEKKIMRAKEDYYLSLWV